MDKILLMKLLKKRKNLHTYINTHTVGNHSRIYAIVNKSLPAGLPNRWLLTLLLSVSSV